jgi:hypothetical protein
MRNVFHSPTGLSAFASGLEGFFSLFVETAGALLVVPDLHLGAAAQVDSAVSRLLDLPVDEHLEVAVVFYGAEVFPFAVEHDHAALHFPVLAHGLVCGLLRFRQLVGRHLRALGRALHETLPAGEILPVEEWSETLGRLDASENAALEWMRTIETRSERARSRFMDASSEGMERSRTQRAVQALRPQRKWA